MSALNAMTPMTSSYNLSSMTPEQQQHLRWEAEVDERNRPISDAELDALFPPGYKILDPPASYVPLRTPSRKLLTTPTPLAGTPGFSIMPTPARETYAVPPTPSESALPFIKQEDYQYFGKLLDDSVSEELLDESEQKERKIMRLVILFLRLFLILIFIIIIDVSVYKIAFKDKKWYTTTKKNCTETYYGKSKRIWGG